MVYFIEARRADGSVIVRRGSAADPMVVALVEAAKPAVAATATPNAVRQSAPAVLLRPARRDRRRHRERNGRGDAQQRDLVGDRLDAGRPAGAGDRLLRHPAAAGSACRPACSWSPARRPFTSPNPDPGECGSDHICSPFTGAFAGLAKAAWSFLDPESAFQPYASLSAGYGTIRHVAKVSVAPDLRLVGRVTGTCMDTVAGGPVLFGPGVGFQYRVADAVGLVAEIDGLVGVPHFTVNVDLNVGVAFQL